MIVVSFDGHADYFKDEKQISAEKFKPGPDYPTESAQQKGPNRFWCNPNKADGHKP